jgi:hypothetical protein
MDYNMSESSLSPKTVPNPRANHRPPCLLRQTPCNKKAEPKYGSIIASRTIGAVELQTLKSGNWKPYILLSLVSWQQGWFISDKSLFVV